jgi:hypothetical protein
MDYLRRKIKGYTIAIGIFSLIVIVTSSGIKTTSINYFDINPIRFAYGKANQMSSNSNSNNTNTNSLDVQNIPAKKVHVGDIDIAYKVFGKGDPYLLISGSGLVMAAWDPTMLRTFLKSHSNYI